MRSIDMFKKIGIALLLAVVLLTSGISLTGGQVIEVHACRTISECREQAQTTRNNIAVITEEADEVGVQIAELQTEIDSVQGTIDDLNDEVRVLELELLRINNHRRELSEEISEALIAIAETNERIDDLSEIISNRMRATQRFNNTNTILSQLSGAESLTEFVNVIRQAQRAVTTDANLMEELADLMTENYDRYQQLQANVAHLEVEAENFETTQAKLEILRAEQEVRQTELLRYQQQLQDTLDQLYADRAGEQAMLDAISAAEWVLENTPPPPVRTAPESPESSGLAHPMPGARLISEFGWRWGSHHSGVDLVMWGGNSRAPILASAAGVVTVSGWHSGGMGNWIVISHNINGQRVDTVYAHLRYSPPVSVGDIVYQGQVIGTKGSTGHSYGAHLHFEVHPNGFSWGSPRGVNPRLWVNF